MSRYVAALIILVLTVFAIAICLYYLLTQNRHNRKNAVTFKSYARSYVHYKHNVITSNGKGKLINQPGECKPFSVDNRIHGGTNASIGDFPSIALLEYNVTEDKYNLDCGGSLINHRYVITAAHCLHKKILINVRLGEYDTSRNPDVDEDNEPLPEHLNVGVEKCIIHENYSEKRLINDIGLIRLSVDVPFKDYFVRPICIPDSNMSISVGEKLVVPGWGNTGDKKYSPILQKVTIPYYDFEECQRIFLPSKIVQSQLCAGGKKGSDACNRDSGGPLIREYNRRTFIEGIVSFGHGCGKQGIPGVYTRVSYYYDWIRDNLEP